MASSALTNDVLGLIDQLRQNVATRLAEETPRAEPPMGALEVRQSERGTDWTYYGRTYRAYSDFIVADGHHEYRVRIGYWERNGRGRADTFVATGRTGATNYRMQGRFSKTLDENSWAVSIVKPVTKGWYFEREALPPFFDDKDVRPTREVLPIPHARSLRLVAEDEETMASYCVWAARERGVI